MIEGEELRLENRHTGEVLRLSRAYLEGGEEVIRLRTTSPPRGGGPPPHIHTRENERGTVLAGRLGVVVDGEETVYEAGDDVMLPAGRKHTWWNAGDEALEWEGIAYPAVDLDRYLQAMFAVVNAGEAGRPPLLYAAHVMHRHRDTQRVAVMPGLVMRILIPALVLFGRLTGRYRGDDWPGAPGSCGGAPYAERTEGAEVRGPKKR